MDTYSATRVHTGGQRFSSRIITPIALLTDILCLALAAPMAFLLYALALGGRHDLEINASAAIVTTISFLLIRVSRDAYTTPLSRMGDADHSVIIDFLIAALLSVCMIWQFGLIDTFSRGLMAFYAASSVTMLFLSRFALRKLVWRLSTRGHISQRVVIFSADTATAQRALRLLELERLPHLTVVGVADDRKKKVAPASLGKIPHLGGFAEVVDLAREGEVDQVLIAMSDITQERLDEVVEQLSGVSIDICLLPREAMMLSSSYKVGFIGSSPVLTIWERPVRDTDILLKSLEDKVVALVGLVVLAPVMVLAAILIKLTSRGPVLFVQRRFGLNNVSIDVLKFRSMYVDRQDVSGAQRTTQSDGRVTPVGRVIRRLSIDELPQLWNVLRGDMSIVGPRPHATQMKVGDRYYFDAVRGYAARHRVKPGLTGLAQVRGLRGEIATLERARMRVEYDRFYIENWSLMLDLRIIFETAIKLVFDRHAY